MRSAALLGALTLVLAATRPAPAQHTPDIRYVTLDRAEVRCGPSTDPKLYPTDVLERGTPVEVVEERQDGWLVIRPPRDSFSWINTRFLEHIVPNQPNWVVVQEGVRVPVMIGSAIQKGRPTVVGARLERGTQVRSIGRPLADDEGTWMPIEPPPGEVRYIRKEVVSRNPTPLSPTPAPERRPDPVVFNTYRSAPPPSPPAPPPSPAPAPPPPADVDTLWRQAQHAESEGHIAEAVRLYTQASTEGMSLDRQRALDALNRANFLRYSDRQSGSPTSAPSLQGTPSVAHHPGDSEGRLYPLPAAAPPTARLTAPDPGPPASSVPSSATAPGWSLQQADAAGIRASGPGRLRRAGRCVEYRRTYVLETSEGIPTLYVTPQDGLDLDPYVNRNVELFGPAVYRGDLRANYMTVVRVQLLP